MALGGPLLGRMIDSRGLRLVLLVTVAAQGVFWLAVPVLPYGSLLVASVLAGLLMVPAQAVGRQAIAAMTTAEQRRAAFALESVQGELSYIVGPAVVILGAATVSPDVVAWGVGAAILAGGLGIAVLNPPMYGRDEADAAAERPPRRQWLGTRMIAALTMAFGTTTLLSGVDLAIVATLREAGQVSWAAVVVVVFGVSSVVGGLLYGALTRPLPTWLLLGLLGLVTIPAGLAHDWPWLCVAVLGSGLLTAPTLGTVADAVSRLAPPGVRGEVTGLQSSAQSAGFALGAPLVGVAIDLSVPAGGFATAGFAGLAAAVTGYALTRWPVRRSRASAAAATWSRVARTRTAPPPRAPSARRSHVRAGRGLRRDRCDAAATDQVAVVHHPGADGVHARGVEQVDAEPVRCRGAAVQEAGHREGE